MANANFFQILCKNISSSGEDMTGIFDTLICEDKKVRFSICICYSQIATKEDTFDKYYYRLVLRYLGQTKSESKHYRVDSGFFWDETSSDDEITEHKAINLKSSVPGFSGRLTINYGFEAEAQGNYELDLYVKKVKNSEDVSLCEQSSVKDLDLVSVCPFQLIFQNS